MQNFGIFILLCYCDAVFESNSRSSLLDNPTSVHCRKKWTLVQYINSILIPSYERNSKRYHLAVSTIRIGKHMKANNYYEGFGWNLEAKKYPLKNNMYWTLQFTFSIHIRPDINRAWYFECTINRLSVKNVWK